MLFRSILFCLVIFSMGPLSASPVALVHDARERVILTFEAPNPDLQVRTLGDMKYAELTIPGFTTMGDPGGPALPRIYKLIAIPAGMKAVVTSSEKETGTFTIDKPLAPYLGIPRHCSADRQLANPDPRLYKLFRNDPFVVVDHYSYIGPVRVAMITINPIRVSHSSKKLTFTKKALIKIDFIKDGRRDLPPVNPVGLGPHHHDYFRSFVLNDAAMPRFERAKRIPTDLIIVHQDYLETIQKLVAFKESQGRGVIVKPFLNPTKNDVLAYIKEKYQSATPPDHTLLVGNIDQIPSYRRGGYWTDYNYSLLDSGPYPDISLGRLAANTQAELNAQLDKIIARETTPRDNGSVLMTSGFETNWCQENLHYIDQNILSHSHQELSVEKRYASDGYRTASVVAAYNDNPNIIIYDGHGNQDGMTEIPLYRRHLDQLTNTTFPIILDIACLNSQWPSSGATQTNFADRIATAARKGAAGIMSSSYYSGGHDLFRHILRANVYDENNSSEPYHMINEIGRMIHYGKIKYLEQYGASAGALDDNYMFFYHGDPATTFFGESK